MKKICGILFLFAFLNLHAQPGAPVRTERWNASWITCPEIASNDYNVVMFRKKFELSTKPSSFLVHITADNKYKLFVNEKYIGFGPQASDMRHWRFETIDIAPFLKQGENIIAAEVTNWGPDRAFGLISVRTAFLLQGYSKNEELVNSDDKTWKTQVNKAVSLRKVNWMYGIDAVGGFYAAQHGDSIRAELYPWGWKSIDYPDSAWKKPEWVNSASTSGGAMAWLLMPRNTPMQKDSLERFTKIARATGIVIPKNFAFGKAPLIIPAHSKISILIDQTRLTIGYPELTLSGGKDAQIQITYAENLFSDDKLKRGFAKGNRNEIMGKRIIGIKDVYVMDSSLNRLFKTTYHRAFRFIQLDITTQDSPLSILNYYNMYSATSIPVKAQFYCDNNDYMRIFEICRRTSMMCVQDNLMSDAYYEQMQYVGDSRVHNLTHLYLTGDDAHFRNSIEQFHYSRLPDGNITSCYPLKATFVHPTFSLIWIDMIYDYMMHRGDAKFINQFIPDIRAVFDYFDDIMNDNGLVGETKWAYFVDWYKDGGGVAPISRKGNSALVTLHYAYTLQNAAQIFRFLQMEDEAKFYEAKAKMITKTVYQLCYDTQRGMFCENPDKTYLDQRPNIVAVLTDAVPVHEQKALLNKIASDTSLSRAGLYYRFNFFNAIKKGGATDLLDVVMQPWIECLNAGLTTTPEKPIDENPRSEAHPWSTSPVYAFYSIVCGISPAEYGFTKVKIAPAMGNLKTINATFPHQWGNIIIQLSRKNKKGVSGSITLPAKLTGIFEWNGKTILLKEGMQKIEM